MSSSGESCPGAVLLTGATGFVGMELLARYLERTDRDLVALVRASDDEAAQARLGTTLTSLYGREDIHRGRVAAIAADIERPGLGLSPARRSELAGGVSEIVRAAASVSFSLPLEDSRRINVEGTRRLLEFGLEATSRGGLASAPVDVVPIDYVPDVIFALATRPIEESAETFALVAGRHATTVTRLARLAARYLGARPPRIVPAGLYKRLLHPILLRRGPQRRRRAIARGDQFFPYFTMRVVFDDRRARRRLEHQGIRVSPIEHYLHRLIDFAREADWGRRSLPRHRPVRRQRVPVRAR